MICTLHTFGRNLKWNPYIHVLVTEMIYDPVKDKIKRFHYFDFKMLRKTFQFELIRLMEENCGLKNKAEKTRLYNNHPNGFYVYAKYDDFDRSVSMKSTKKDFIKDIQGCINYCMRYASRPAMAESRIEKYDKEAGTVEWLYHAHEDGKRHDVVDNVQEFIKKLIIHIPDKHFRTVRYYGFYSNKAQKTLDRAHELLGKKKRRTIQDILETKQRRKR